MASLHKDAHGRSPYFYAAFRLPNGKRAFKSTKETDRKKAERIANKWEDAAGLASKGELTEEASRKVLDEIRKIVGDSPLPVITVRQFFENWLAGKKLSRTGSTGKRYEKPVAEFLKSLGPRADKLLGHLVVQDVQNFRDTRIRSGVRLSTVSFDVGLVRRVLASANNQGLISNNPAKAVELESSKSQKHSVLSPDDIRALLAQAEPDWKTAILIGYYTGARLSDATAMTWDEVNLSEGLITYTQRKTSNQVKVPIHSQLEEHLLAIAGDKNGSLCPSLAGKPGNGRSGLSTQFAELMIKAGIDRQVQASQKRKFSAVSFHSLRHSYVSNLANAEVPAELRKELAGHTASEVHDRYTHRQIEPLRKAIQALPRLP